MDVDKINMYALYKLHMTYKIKFNRIKNEIWAFQHRNEHLWVDESLYPIIQKYKTKYYGYY